MESISKANNNAEDGPVWMHQIRHTRSHRDTTSTFRVLSSSPRAPLGTFYGYTTTIQKFKTLSGGIPYVSFYSSPDHSRVTSVWACSTSSKTHVYQKRHNPGHLAPRRRGTRYTPSGLRLISHLMPGTGQRRVNGPRLRQSTGSCFVRSSMAPKPQALHHIAHAHR